MIIFFKFQNLKYSNKSTYRLLILTLSAGAPGNDETLIGLGRLYA